MIKPVKMKKVKVIAPLKYKHDVSLLLHKSGAAHINDISKRITDAEWRHIVSGKVVNTRQDQFFEYLGRLDDIDRINSRIPKNDVSKRSFLPKAMPKITVSESSDDEISRRIDKILFKIEARTLEIRDEIAKLDESLEELSDRRNVLELLSGVDSRLDVLCDSSYFSNMLFKTGKEKFNKAKAKLYALGKIVIEKTDSGNDSYVLLSYPKELDDAVAGCLSGTDVVKIEIPPISSRPKDEIHKTDRKIKALKCEKECHSKELYALKEKYGSDVALLKEEAGIILDRYTIFGKCACTESSFVLEFFVPEKKEKEIVSCLKEATDGKVIIYSIEPMVEEQPHKVPVLLSNPALLKPFEGLVNMYSVPKYNDFDPTIFIAPAMMLFFGIMLNDAGYGLLMALIGVMIYRSYADVNEGGKNAGIMLVMLGSSAVVFGIISGGYFGDALRRVFPDLWYLIDPLGESHVTFFGASVENPILFVLVFSLVVGVVYINIGYIIGILDCVSKIRGALHTGQKKTIEGQYSQIVSHLGIMVFQVGLFGLVFYWKLGWFVDVAYFSYMAGAVMIAGIVMLAKSGGVQTLFGFFDITGYVGDDLSFIRLLAL
ncbi:MAG: V-type ATPase 116kDa subunit family protein, partial [archaeon]